jgi:hypothetical protein
MSVMMFTVTITYPVDQPFSQTSGEALFAAFYFTAHYRRAMSRNEVNRTNYRHSMLFADLSVRKSILTPRLSIRRGF